MGNTKICDSEISITRNPNGSLTLSTIVGSTLTSATPSEMPGGCSGRRSLKMASAYFAPLVLAPIVIDGPGKYLTRSGEPIDITCSSRRNDFGCIGRYGNGIVEHWHRSGRLFAGMASANDVVAKYSSNQEQS